MHWPDSFQANRRIRGANLLLQAILFTTLFAGLNYLAQVHSWRFDLTRNRIFSLSEETTAYVKLIEQPVHAVVAFDTTSDDAEVAQARRDVVALLREYARVLHRGNPVVTFEEIDVLQSRRRAEQLGITEKNVVVFTSGDRRRTVRQTELYRIANLEKVAFLGEREFTAAILDVTTAEKQKVYFLTGHGELEPSSADELRGLSEFRAELRSRNLAIETLDLRSANAIPEGAALLLSIAPLQPFLPREQELLRQFLNNRTGRLLLAIDPNLEREVDTGLAGLLGDWGIDLPDCLVWDPAPDARMPGGDLILRRYSKHDVVAPLFDSSTAVSTGLGRVVQLSQARPNNAAIAPFPLIVSSDAGFGERTFRGRTEFTFDPATDLGGPVAIAAVSEGASAVGNLPFSVRSGRLAVFGSSDFFTNGRFGVLGNSMLAVNSVNWALGRVSQVNVQPRPLEKFQLTLSETDLRKLRLALLLIVPGGVALFGVIVYWSRRS